MRFRPLPDRVDATLFAVACARSSAKPAGCGAAASGPNPGFEWTGTREKVLDLTKLICAAILIGSTWELPLSEMPAWNLRVCGYAMWTASLAALIAEAEWEPRTNFWLGIWVLTAPWILHFSHETQAVFVHVLGGALVSTLSVAEVWSGERNPPWRFGPGAAQRALFSPVMTDLPDQITPRRMTNIHRQRFLPGRARSTAARGLRAIGAKRRRAPHWLGADIPRSSRAAVSAASAMAA